jgi:5'-phosphate synthase pdxT subunit
MELRLDRNTYGRQQESFEARIKLDVGDSFPGVFIRAPGITATGGTCRPIAWHNGNIVGAVQPPHMALTFHPELTGDRRLHQRWLEMVPR